MVSSEELITPSGFRVDVVDPANIYRFIKSSSQFASEDEPVSEELNSIENVGDLIDFGTTSITIEGGEGASYVLQSVFSPSLKIDPGLTFFSSEEVDQMRDSFVSHGYKVAGGRSLQLTDSNGYTLELDLGFEDQSAL